MRIYSFEEKSKSIDKVISKTLDGRLSSATIEFDATKLENPEGVWAFIPPIIRSKGYEVDYMTEDVRKGHIYHFHVRRQQ